MSKALYIGHYDVGSTSRMRGEYLKQLLPQYQFSTINLDIPINATPRLLRSLGWRYKIGPFIKNISNHIVRQLNGEYGYDLVWIDKGVFIEPDIVQTLRQHSRKLVHFTPDPAFTYHRSNLFYNALRYYDFCVTTKSFEIESYKKFGVQTIFCTQGYDPHIHKPLHQFKDKRGVVFIGHKEEEREFIIAKLVEKNICVTLAGNHWDKFALKRKNNANLIYRGKGIFGEEYARAISGALIGLGLLSRWIPELHTTRTFEIPACKTALATEHNPETGSIFSDEEAIFYDDADEAILKVEHYLAKKEKLMQYTELGYNKVTNGGYSYLQILKKVLAQVNE